MDRNVTPDRTVTAWTRRTVLGLSVAALGATVVSTPASAAKASASGVAPECVADLFGQ